MYYDYNMNSLNVIAVADSFGYLNPLKIDGVLKPHI